MYLPESYNVDIGTSGSDVEFEYHRYFWRGCSWYINKISDGTSRVFQHPLPHKGKVQQIAETSSSCDMQRFFHNPSVNHYCSLKCKEEQVHGKPAWLQPFLLKEFFNNCSAHNLSNNETNMYCIDCDLPICKHCFSPSGSCGGHRTLRIYKHVKQDAVVGKDLKELIDCSKIQLYKCNKNRVVVVHPLDNKVKDQEVAGSCDICKRNLHNPAAYRYCSLECKVKAFLRKEKATDPPFLKLGAAAAAAAAATDRDAAEAAGIRETAAADIVETTAERKKKRKGVPHRAI